MENQKDLSTKVVDRMFNNDPFSQWLGIERLEVRPGHCVLRMTVRDEMLNGFSIAHGGITYSLADSALAFASNGHGRMSVSVETSISHTQPARTGDVLTATATELNRTDKIALYEVRVTNQDGKPVAFFKGTVYRTPKPWFPDDESL
ncbi:MAG: PaaI family thioesterase [Bacteroidota bacterium]